MAGCGEGDAMLMSKPTELELVSTDVAYRVAEFDINTDYEDGTEVRVNTDEIHVTKRVYSEVPSWVEGVDYQDGAVVVVGGNTYLQKHDPLAHAPCSSGGGFATYEIDNVVEWDGLTKTADLVCSPSPQLPLGIDITFTFTLDENQSTAEYRYFDAALYDNINSTALPAEVYKVHKNIYTAPIGGHAIYRGYLSRANTLLDDSLSNNVMWQEVQPRLGIYTISTTYIRASIKLQPLDSKQYTSVVEAVPQTWVVKSLSKFDTVAIGRLKGDTVTVVFKDSTGTEITRHDNMPIDGRIDVDGRLPYTYTTMILYSDSDIDVNGTIEITVNGASTEVGMIKAGLSINLGFTNLEFKNNGKDYSPKQQSAISGYIDYIEGVKVMVHKGSIDVPVERYDITSRFIRDFLGSLMIINGSDAKNSTPDNQGIFSATQLIARISSMDMGTKIKDGDIEPMVPIPFVCEEIV